MHSQKSGHGTKRVLVIYNPTAGQWRQRRLRATLTALDELGCLLRLYETKCPGDAETVARQISLNEADVVVAAGGDGTINEVANGLVNAKHPIPPLAIIPLGTANVLAQEIGLSGCPAKIAKAIACGKQRTVHLGIVNDRHFLMMAGVGFDAHIVAHVHGTLKRHTGKGAYVLETLWQALRYGFPVCRVALSETSRNAYSIVVCNGRHYGGPFIAAPSADLCTPSLEVCLLHRRGWVHVLHYGLALIRGELAGLSDVTMVTMTRLRIDGPSGLPVQGDGDIIAHLPVDIAVSDHTLELIFPG